MICWSCERSAAAGRACAHCGALLPPPADIDHFAVLGVPRRFELAADGLERAYKTLSRELHPDRFARADARARRHSLGWSVKVNDAYRTLRDPVKRAEYLLRLAGADGGEGEKAEVPAALLQDMLELRSELAEARLEGDDARVAALAADMRERTGRAMAAVAAGFAAEPPRLPEIARELVALRYYRRFLDEVEVHEDARLGVARA